MQNISPTPEFQSGAVQPMVCLRGGYDLIKDQYWLFVGMCFVAILIGSAVPFGILMGPMMCGIYLAFFKVRRGQPVEFGDLFKGFDYFGQSLIATLIHIIPIMIVFVPSYIAFYVSLFLMMPRQGGEPDPAAMLTFFGVFAIFWFVIIVFVMVVSILFTFTYPLIIDRGLSGLDSVKLSVRAGLANFWRLLGLFLINGVLGMVGMLLCYVGVVLVLPVTFGALASAYERVFGLGAPLPSNLPPPPPTFS